MLRRKSRDTFFGHEYLAALRTHYPELLRGQGRTTVDRVLHVGIVATWLDQQDTLGVDPPNRFRRISERPWMSESSVWAKPLLGRNVRHAGVYFAYKGLIHLKPPTDLVLYSNLIWELQPRTILEFGSLQGGSGLWLADQLDALCGQGEVHSFDLFDRCVSPRASHSRLTFHHVDLRDLTTIDARFVSRLPHPWLVIDDAHVNLVEVVPFVVGFMRPGDYYVIEDAFNFHSQRVGRERTAFDADEVAHRCDALGLFVDTKFTDAFGINATTSPNGWLTLR